jgi:hypothetical protein
VATVTKTVERAESLTAVAGAIDAPQHRGLRMFLFGSELGLSLELPREILKPYWLSPADQGKHSLTFLAKQRILQKPRLIAEILGLLRGGATPSGEAPWNHEGCS